MTQSIQSNQKYFFKKMNELMIKKKTAPGKPFMSINAIIGRQMAPPVTANCLPGGGSDLPTAGPIR